MGYRMTVMPKTGVKEFNKEREREKLNKCLSCLEFGASYCRRHSELCWCLFPWVAGTF